ncbi:MAG TPA: c-type cytochrome [Actinomycetota bacterium]|jgi:ubiquinol-cytochrome c reductase cytochrome c subunit|nr:c-type cytochrome [Actinomycetota bacterium]
MLRRLRVLGAFALMVAVTVACTPLEEKANVPFRPPGVNTPIEAADAGRVLYDRDCAWCHGSRGEGTKFGPDLNGELDGGAYTHFMLETGRMPLEGPTAEAMRGPPRYPEREIDEIVAYVKTFGGTGPDVPEVDVAAGDLARGAAIYLDDCAACHASTGAGGALTSGQVVPDLQHASDLAVAEAVLVGPGCPNGSRTCGPGEGAMPRFQLDQDDLNSLVRYVDYLHRPEDTGGAPIGRIGPVPEGAVALGIGLVVLLFVARWIGTRIGERG